VPNVRTDADRLARTGAPAIWKTRHRFTAAALATGLLATAGTAQAQEVRLGAGYAPHGPEKGASVVIDHLFSSPQVLKFAGAPRPYVGAQLSLEGYTNYAQAGLIWRFEQKRTYVDLGAGLSVHDGALSLPRPSASVSDEENQRRRHDRNEFIEFDKRWVFHATFAVGLRLDEHWAVEVQGQHWSNGQFGSSTHDGADSLGLRAAYRY
jgi:hypothetical protein